MTNRGISFGINIPGILFVQLFFLGMSIYLWWHDKKAWGWLLIFLGGLFNFLERVIEGVVIDYWRIPFTNIYNNINDYLIFIGIIQVIYFIWKKRQK